MTQMTRSAILSGAFLLLWAAERIWPLRPPTQRRAPRLLINVGFGVLSAAALALGYAFVLPAIDRWSAERGLGVTRWLGLSPMVRTAVAFVLLDYTLWHWHRQNHRAPLLWRFHAAHHADLDLDVSTALRFHVGELTLSIPVRALQIVLLGVDVTTLLAWEALTFLLVAFQHSNVRLPLRLEQVLQYVLITPRLHGVHHSTVAAEVSSNFGTISTWWDRLHGTHLWGPPQNTIGLADVRDPKSLGEALAMPFAAEQPELPRRKRDSRDQ